MFGNSFQHPFVVAMTGLKSILSVTPDLQVLNEFCIQIGVDIIILYSSETVSEECSYRTRVFAPTFGYLEDPATGSGNAAFCYYLLKQCMWNGEKIKIEQNGFRESPNYVKLFSKETKVKIRKINLERAYHSAITNSKSNF